MCADGEHVWSITWIMWMMATALAMSLIMGGDKEQEDYVLHVEPSCGEQNHSLYLKMSKYSVNARTQTVVGQRHETLVTRP